MSIVDEIRERLKDANLLSVSRASGVSYETVRKLAQGRADNVKHASVVRLAEYLEVSCNV